MFRISPIIVSIYYPGPKLYVKPNQKSNRHIIINAIKDCCLAGVVNQDVKSKVMEVWINDRSMCHCKCYVAYCVRCPKVLDSGMRSREDNTVGLILKAR